MIRMTIIAASAALFCAGFAVAQQADLEDILHGTSPLTAYVVEDDGEGGGSMSAVEIDSRYGHLREEAPDVGYLIGSGRVIREDAPRGRPQAVPSSEPALSYAPATSGGKTCYTGPRGGTYTITRSGKKNYSGC